MPWHTPERKCEQALKTYLETVLSYEIAGVQIATRFSNADLTEPRIEIFCGSCQPWEEATTPYTGNWMCEVTLRVVSHYAPGVDAVTHDNYVGELLDKFLLRDDVTGAEAATTEINATLYDVDLELIQLDVGARTNTTDEHSLVTEQELVLYVKPSNQGDI